jgi:hypothetical protein
LSTRYDDIGNIAFAQGNRNPFVDHPEWVWAIFGDQANDSRLSVAPPGADGSSTTSLNLGKVIVGASTASLSQAIALSKDGSDPTYFEVSTTGQAVSSLTGRNNAMTYGAGTRSLTVGLSSDTNTAGIVSGSIVIDNLDVTTGGGMGRGADDGNDIINVTVSVLNHSNASFDATSDVNSLIFDLGNVTVGNTAAAATALRNIANGLTADLDLDSVVAVGDTSVFWLELSPFQGLPGGAAEWFGFSFSPVTTGTFSVTYTLNNSDEDIPGASFGAPLTLTLVGSATQSLVVPEPFSLLLLLSGLCVPRPRR